MLELAFRGGFPEAIKLTEKDRQQWHRDYTDALLLHDLNNTVRINRHSAMQDLAGKLMETLVFNELTAQIDTSFGEY